MQQQQQAQHSSSRRRDTLPAPSAAFRDRKARILRQLAAPEGEYADASPKGSVDAGIRRLIDEINEAEGFVTTSSCAGRVSVFLEGRKGPAESSGGGVGEADAEEGEGERREQRAGVGGKGAGGTWLYVSHDPVPDDNDADEETDEYARTGPGSWAVEALGFSEAGLVDQRYSHDDREQRLIHFKFEPMILHVLTASPAHAQVLLRSGLQAGFRESGAVNVAPAGDTHLATPMVAIRSMGLGLESLIGWEAGDGARGWFVSRSHLETLRAIANERFAENAKRIDRFRTAFLDATTAAAAAANGWLSAETGGRADAREWEDAVARRQRMRAEGLRRKAALAAAAGKDEVMAESSEERAEDTMTLDLS